MDTSQPDAFIEMLGIVDRPAAEQQDILLEFQMRVGDQLMERATDEQNAEYRDIINDNREVIQRWLDQHAPDYRESEAFMLAQQQAAMEEDDIWPEKIYASMAWITVTFPDYQEIVAQVAEQYRQELQNQ